MRKLAATLLVLLMLAASGEARPKLPKPKRGIQMRMAKFVVPPGGEREVCEFRVMPNKKPLDVQEFELNMTPGSHHFVVWEYLGQSQNPADFPTELVDSPGCIGVGPRDAFVANANLFGMQTARARQRFPKGVAVRLQPSAYVILNFHIKNPSLTEPLLAESVFNMRAAKKGSVKHYAQALVVGNMADIRIPARGTQMITSDWHAPVDLNVVQVSTHQHKRGTYADVHLIDEAGNDLGPLFQAADWEHPGERWFDPAFRLAKGQGIRFTCGWSNPDDRVVTFGVTTDDEMCFATGYFYTDDGSTPAGPNCIPQAEGMLCFTRALP